MSDDSLSTTVTSRGPHGYRPGDVLRFYKSVWQFVRKPRIVEVVEAREESFKVHARRVTWSEYWREIGLLLIERWRT